MTLRARLQWLAGVVALTGTTLAARTTEQPRVTAFVDVAVIDMIEPGVARDQTVLVWGDRIVAVGPTSTIRVPADAHRIPGRGRFLIPGLTDAHVHFRADSSVNAALLELYAAYGVTSVFGLSGRPEHLALGERIASGALLGPTLYTSGPILDDSTLTFADGERLVAEQVAAGYRAIKVYNRLARPAYWGIIAAAKRAGIPVVGHVVRGLDADGLARCEPARVVCACDHCFEATLTSGQAAIVHMEEVMYGHFKHHATRSRRPLSELVPEIPAVSRRVAASGVWVIPTLEVFRNIPRQLDSLSAVLARPEMRYMPAAMRDNWVAEKNPYRRSMKPADAPAFWEAYTLLALLTKGFQDAGVKLLAGTDVGVPSVIAGLSLHWELQHFVEAGLTPYEALATATRLPGEFLDRGRFGTVAPGQRADLLLLEANPLEDITNTLRQAGVMFRGHWLSAAALRQRLEARSNGAAPR